MSAGADQRLLGGLDAVALGERLRYRELGCRELATAFLEALGADELNAWSAVDPELLLARAAALDCLSERERSQLALFGLPVGVKDNFDTADLATADGSSIYDGHRPVADAAAVQIMRAAGAMIAGKTKCTEFAWMTATDTRNPLDRSRTPGGSSSG